MARKRSKYTTQKSLIVRPVVKEPTETKTMVAKPIPGPGITLRRFLFGNSSAEARAFAAVEKLNQGRTRKLPKEEWATLLHEFMRVPRMG